MSFGKRLSPPLLGQAWTPAPAIAAPAPASAAGFAPIGDAAPEQYAMPTAADWTPGASTRRGDAGLPLPDRRLALKIGAAALLLPLWVVFSVWAENGRPIPRDLQPGLTLAAEPYVAPTGCPARTWSVGDYLPRACRHGQWIRASAAGLESPGSQRHELRTQTWLRAGPDALAAACPILGDCLVQRVVRDRFVDRQPSDDPAVEARNFQRPTLSYRLTYPVNTPIWGTVALISGLGILFGRTFRR